MIRHRPILTRTTIAILLACLLTLGFTVATVAPAAATHDDGDDGSLSSALTPSEDSYLAGAWAALAGASERARYAIFGPENTATESRDDAIQAFNRRNDSFIQYANNRSLHEGEVVQIDCVIDDETATGYIVADYNDSLGEYTSAKAVTSTDRAVDHTVTLEENACDNAAEEIEYFHDEFASNDKDVTRTYMASMAAKYSSNVDEPFTGGS